MNDDYIKKFSITSGYGFKVNGETWALTSYRFFWESLLKTQQEKKAAGDTDRLVVRITHSNSIDIWGRDIPQVQALLKVQKRFCTAGGAIARVFIGSEPEANADSYDRPTCSRSAVAILRSASLSRSQIH